MKRENFYTGEPVDTGSPPFYESAETMASFGKYNYDPSERSMVSIGGYNYYPQQQVGIGYPSYNFGYNSAYQYGYANYNQYYQQPQQISYHIEPLNFGGSEYLPPIDYEEKIEKLKMHYWMKEQELAQNTNNSCGPYGYSSNYYGTPYFYSYNNYNSALNAEIRSEIEKMKEDARNARFNLNLQLSKLAHNICGDEYDEDALVERFKGKTIVAEYSAPVMRQIYQSNRFANLTPFDNSQMYREHSLNVSREYNSIIPKDANLAETFANMGVVYANYEMEEEQHRRRNSSVLYDSSNNAYKYFVRSKVAEREAAKKSGSFYNINTFSPEQNLMDNFPTLSQSAHLCDDGTLNITCNFGSKAGQVYSVHNSQEAEYNEDRERFNRFLNSIPGSIYNPYNPSGSGGGGNSD